MSGQSGGPAGRQGPADIEPLEPTVWVEALECLYQRSAGGEAIEQSLRHAFHLSQLAPRTLRPVFHCSRSDEEFEGLLEAEAFDEAALALLGDQLGCEFRRPDGQSEVTAKVWLPGNEAAHEIARPSIASALLGAWLVCILAMKPTSELSSSKVIRLASHRPRALSY